MKRYISGIFAVVIAATAVAFTLPKNNYVNKFFTYSGSDYKDASVKNINNWSYSGTAHTLACNGTDVKACEIEVDPSFVNPNNTLKSLDIETQSSSTNVFYVTGGDMVDYQNKN